MFESLKLRWAIFKADRVFKKYNMTQKERDSLSRHNEYLEFD